RPLPPRARLVLSLARTCSDIGGPAIRGPRDTSGRVHLRAIKIRGFKSFPDPVEVRLEPGVAVVVGPNGSGKSNVADALVWAAGRRTDVVELLADVGLGPGTGSIVGQGRVEAILASRPDERRSLVEEAAGLGRFKRQRHRAELKLARVAQEVARARDVEAEVAKRLRPLALQATAAERAEKLGGEIVSLRAGIAAIDLA